MAKQSNSEEQLRSSIGDLYSQLLSKRKTEKEAKREAKRQEDEAREAEKEAQAEEPKLSKKEKRQAELDNWKEIVIGLTGDDLEYSEKKPKKKKYRKWIDDDEVNAVLDQKKKKPKKRNYNKEFEPELNMLRNLVAEQNKFTADLQKRFQFAAGPASKDGLMPNKTLVELANVISSGRSNSLGVLREIGAIKKTIAELYMKQKKLDSDLGGANVSDMGDLGLMGSNIAASLLTSPMTSYQPNPAYGSPMQPEVNPTPAASMYSPIAPSTDNVAPLYEAVAQPYENFDPDTWTGPEVAGYTAYENIPHSIIVEKSRTSGAMRFKAIRDDNGEELVGCPVPTSDLSRLSINEKDNTVKGSFDEVYKLQYVD